MRIGIDISQLAHKGGVATYTQNLAERLFLEKDLNLVFFYSSLRKSFRGNLKNVKSYRLPPTLFEVLFNKIRSIPIEKFIGDIDIFHSSDWVQPPTKAKKVTTYHDLTPILYPGWSHPKIVDVHKRRLRIVEKEIDIVIAVSESTKKDLMKVSSIPDHKIVVIYEGADERFKPQNEKNIEVFKKKYNLPEEFVLAIGGVGQRRNLKNIKKACEGLNLVISGETIPWVSDEELPLLYASSKMLLYPSFYEGFGLPIIEAQACGTPVITSNVSSMPEIAGEGAILVEPGDVRNIKIQVEKLFKDQNLRQSLTKNGRNNIKRFDWGKCIQETVKVYRGLVE